MMRNKECPFCSAKIEGRVVPFSMMDIHRWGVVIKCGICFLMWEETIFVPDPLWDGDHPLHKMWKEERRPKML
jgi:hypothetical protein